MEETIEFALTLKEAGVSCITLHMRRPFERDGDEAHWDMILPLVKAMYPIPVLANGDLYRWPDIEALRSPSSSSKQTMSSSRPIEDNNVNDDVGGIERGVSGVMLGRPALMNLSMFRRQFDDNLNEFRGLPLLPIDKVVTLYIEECIRFDLIYQYAKYTVVEMLNTRRHQKRFYDRKVHLVGREMLDVSRTNSLEELGLLFGIDNNRFNEIVNQRSSITSSEWNEIQLNKINEYSLLIKSTDVQANLINVPVMKAPVIVGETSTTTVITSETGKQTEQGGEEEGPLLKKTKVDDGLCGK